MNHERRETRTKSVLHVRIPLRALIFSYTDYYTWWCWNGRGAGWRLSAVSNGTSSTAGARWRGIVQNGNRKSWMSVENSFHFNRISPFIYGRIIFNGLRRIFVASFSWLVIRKIEDGDDRKKNVRRSIKFGSGNFLQR